MDPFMTIMFAFVFLLLIIVLVVWKSRIKKQCTTCMWYHRGMSTPFGTKDECSRPSKTTGRPIGIWCEDERSLFWPADLISGTCGSRARFHAQPKKSTVYSNEEFEFGGQHDANTDSPGTPKGGPGPDHPGGAGRLRQHG